MGMGGLRIRARPVVLLREAAVGANGAHLRRLGLVFLENGSDPLILVRIGPGVAVRVRRRFSAREVAEEVVLAPAEERGGVPD